MTKFKAGDKVKHSSGVVLEFICFVSSDINEEWAYVKNIGGLAKFQVNTRHLTLDPTLSAAVSGHFVTHNIAAQLEEVPKVKDMYDEYMEKYCLDEY